MALTLPKKNSLGLYEIRMESIGGYGANVTGKILAEALVLGQGFNGSNFSSYGSEKKGTPVKAYVRVAEPDVAIRTNSPVEEPHILVIFHEMLLKTYKLTQGVRGDAVVIVNTSKSPDEMRDVLKLCSGTVVCIDATRIAIEEKSRANMVLLGAVTKMSGFIDLNAVKGAVKHAFEKKYGPTIPGNLKTIARGFNEGASKHFDEDGSCPYLPPVRVTAQLGYETQPIGAVITASGNSIAKDLSTSRQGFIPVLNHTKCTSCGECDIACPDLCMVWVEKEDPKTHKPNVFLEGIDYQYCKGCMQCVTICKFAALTTEKEADHDVSSITVRHHFNFIEKY